LNLIEQYNLPQKKVAKMLNLTNAAVCQYASNKRGCEIDFNEEIKQEINISTRKIYNDGTECFSLELCRICKIVRDKKNCEPLLAIYED